MNQAINFAYKFFTMSLKESGLAKLASPYLDKKSLIVVMGFFNLAVGLGL